MKALLAPLLSCANASADENTKMDKGSKMKLGNSAESKRRYSKDQDKVEGSYSERSVVSKAVSQS